MFRVFRILASARLLLELRGRPALSVRVALHVPRLRLRLKPLRRRCCTTLGCSFPLNAVAEFVAPKFRYFWRKLKSTRLATRQWSSPAMVPARCESSQCIFHGRESCPPRKRQLLARTLTAVAAVPSPTHSASSAGRPLVYSRGALLRRFVGEGPPDYQPRLAISARSWLSVRYRKLATPSLKTR